MLTLKIIQCNLTNCVRKINNILFINDNNIFVHIDRV